MIVPGEPLGVAAGYACGFWEGAFVYLAASVVGCFAIIAVVRFGGDRVELVLTRKGHEWLERLRGAQRFDFAILAAFFIPGLPKDLAAYLAAFAGMRPVHPAVVTTAGRLPSVLAITLGSLFARRRRLAGDRHRVSVTAAAVVTVRRHHRFSQRRGCGRCGEVGGQRA